MKKLYILVLACTVLSACNFLNLSDPDSFDEKKFYQSPQDMEGLLASSYSAYRDATKNLFFVTEMKSDNATTTDVGSSGGLYYSFVSHGVMSSNTIVYSLYTNFYQMIHRANQVIEHIDDFAWTNTNERARILAEAHFMRALGHFYLVRLWGPVTKLDHVVSSTAEANNAVRNTEAEVYAQIFSDLKHTAGVESVPAVYKEGSEMYGHATRAAAYALLGRACLQYAATCNHPEYYAEAIDALKKVEELAGMTDLSMTYADIFDVNKKQNAEILFSAQFKATTEDSSPFAAYFQPNGVTGKTSWGKGRGFNTGLSGLYNEVCAQAKTDKRAAMIGKHKDGTYYTLKFKDLTNYVGNGGNDWYEIRMADVFLMLAEAYEHENNTVEAVKYLNKVRMRPGNNVDDYETSLSDAGYAACCPDLRTAIFHERRVEFCFENLRWFDLRRMYPDKADLAAYMRGIADTDAGNKFRDYQAYEALLPIPYNETYLNPGLGQNDGYTAY